MKKQLTSLFLTVKFFLIMTIKIILKIQINKINNKKKQKIKKFHLQKKIKILVMIKIVKINPINIRKFKLKDNKIVKIKLEVILLILKNKNYYKTNHKF